MPCAPAHTHQRPRLPLGPRRAYLDDPSPIPIPPHTLALDPPPLCTPWLHPGWEEIFFDAGAATQDTIVNAWSRHTASEITKTGRKAVESKESAFYFTAAAPGGPAGWAKCWYDIGTGVPANETSLLLGGEMSMWSDSYCYERQCGSMPGAKPVGAALFPPARDKEFGESIGGMIWPRGFVGAAAFWSYNQTADPKSPSFEAAIWSLNDQLAKRGSLTCPTNCSCDQLTACGKPYFTP